MSYPNVREAAGVNIGLGRIHLLFRVPTVTVPFPLSRRIGAAAWHQGPVETLRDRHCGHSLPHAVFDPRAAATAGSILTRTPTLWYLMVGRNRRSRTIDG